MKRVQLYNHSLLCMYHAILFDEGEWVTYIIWQLLLASCESQPTNFKTLRTVFRSTFSLFWRGQVMFLHTTTDYYFLIVCHFPLNLLYTLWASNGHDLYSFYYSISLEQGSLVGKNTNNPLKLLKNIACKTSHAAEWLADFLWQCSACYLPFPHQRAWSWATEVFLVTTL